MNLTVLGYSVGLALAMLLEHYGIAPLTNAWTITMFALISIGMAWEIVSKH
ncbi:MAG: hypothetical protein FWG10_10720 [Eubacteriaceae bacterium]|nr:hypothetical protein [Eubacteriaceae bacterium]